MAKHKAPQSPERHALREAITAHDDAVEQAERAQTLLDKAHALHEDITDQLAGHKDLDAAIAAARANKLKIALASADHPLPPDDGQPEFAAKIIARNNLREHLDQIAVTLPVLESELKDAQKHVERCDIAIEHAAENVICAEAEQLAVEFLATLTALRRQHYVLASFCTRYVRRLPDEGGVRPIAGQLYGTSGPRRVRMSSVTLGAAMENILGDSEIKGGMRVRDAVAQAVSEYWAALKSDADATLNADAAPAAMPAAAE